MSAFLLYKNAYWFVWAYLVLYIFSPVLNSFIENSNRTTIRRFLIIFFVLQTIIFIFTGVGFFKAGYHPLSFFGLYILSRYFRLHAPINGKFRYLAIYLICVLANTLVFFIPAYFGKSNDTILAISISYTNPLNIIASLSILLFFTKLKIKSKLINWFAASCFAVYLLHMHFCLGGYYTKYAKELFDSFSGFTYFAIITIFMVSVFIVSVLIDKIRILCFNTLWDKYEKNKGDQ